VLSQGNVPTRISKSEHPFGAGPKGIPLAISGRSKDPTSTELAVEVALGAGVVAAGEGAGGGACAWTIVAANKAREKLRILISKRLSEYLLFSIRNKTMASPGRDRQ